MRKVELRRGGERGSGRGTQGTKLIKNNEKKKTAPPNAMVAKAPHLLE